jgi:hypothetical protein
MHLVDESMFLINASGPTTLQVVSQWLRLAQACKRFPLNFSNQTNDAERLCSIPFHPPCEVLKSCNVKLQASQ